MGCPTIPLSCLTPEKIFAGVYKPNCAGFADPSNFQAERGIFDSAFNELIHNFGVEIGYYVNTFNLSAMNSIYGEHTTQEYLGPVAIKAYLELEEPSPVYTIAGFDSADTITAFIHIKTFTSMNSSFYVDEHLITEGGEFVLSEDGLRIIVKGSDLPLTQNIEPRAQDKMIINPLGCDRPNGRGAKIFEVTDVMDQSTSDGMNPVMGHYIWRIKGVRNEFNHETNEPQENLNNQAYDNTFSGKLSSSMYPSLTAEGKLYPGNADDHVREKILPPSTGDNDGSAYGGYY